MANPPITKIDFSTGQAVVYADTVKFTFPIKAISGTTPPPVVIPPPVAVPPASVYFPADPGDALFPSPENSNSVVINGAVRGKPYLRDMDGAIHQIVIGTDGVAAYYKGGGLQPIYPGETVSQILVRQGYVYMQEGSGIWKFVQGNGSMYNSALPPAFESAPGGGNTGLPPLGADPAHATMAPGSSGRTLNVTSDADMATVLIAAQAGDTVLVAAGTYLKPIPALHVPLLFKGIGKPVIDMTGVPSNTLAMQKGAIVTAADCIIDGFTIRGAGMDATTHDGTSGIRPSEGTGWLTIRNCDIRDNQNGVAGGGFACVVTIEDTTLTNNGLGSWDGGSHNLYMSTGSTRVVLNRVISTKPNGGHAIKVRSPQFEMHGGAADATDATIIDLPDGTTSKFVIDGGAVLTKPAGSANHGIIGYAMESGTNGVAGGTMTGGSIVALCDSPSMQGHGGTITFSLVTRSGNPITAAGVIVTGL